MNPERSVATTKRIVRAGGCPVVPVAEKQLKPETLSGKLISIIGVLSFGHPQEVLLNK